MAVDLNKFLPLYFAESAEMLSVLEAVFESARSAQALADWRQAERAAHSLKGSSGAFGFEDVLDLAQALELCLHQVVRGEMGATPQFMAAGFSTVKALRVLLQRHQQGLSGDVALSANVGGLLAACTAKSLAGCGSSGS